MTIGLIIGIIAWVGYGNPLRDVVYSGSHETYDLAPAFFANCDAEGNCQVAEGHEAVLHFSFGDGVMGFQGNTQGFGNNPISIMRDMGLGLLPRPNYQTAALKWCSDGQIWQESLHGSHYMIALPEDPTEVAEWVRSQLPRKFDVFIATPWETGRDRVYLLIDP